MSYQSISSSEKCSIKSHWTKLLMGTIALGGTAYYLMRLRRTIRLGAAIMSKSWFSEFSSMWPGQAFSLKIEKELYNGQSAYQHIQVFHCGSIWGNILILDGVIQLTEKDEFAYHEMMTHIPIISHPNPKKVLVIGGGDGGIVRELSHYVFLEEIHLCEIDSSVIDVSKKYFPHVSNGFSDGRVKIHIQDGFSFLKESQNKFDVIIVDSSDPIGPGESLFKKPFYKAAYESLTEYGLLCCQGECMWLHLSIITNIKKFASEVFNSVEYANISLPSYPCGTIGMICCNKHQKYKCSLPCRNEDELILSKLQYYNTDIHRAAFVLPTFVKKSLQE